MKYLLLIIILLLSSCKTYKRNKTERSEETFIKTRAKDLSIISRDYTSFYDIDSKEIKIERFEAIDSSGVTVIKPIVITSTNRNENKREKINDIERKNITDNKNTSINIDTLSVDTDAKSFDVVKSITSGIFGRIKKYLYWMFFIGAVFVLYLITRRTTKKE